MLLIDASDFLLISIPVFSIFSSNFVLGIGGIFFSFVELKNEENLLKKVFGFFSVSSF